MNRHEAVPGLKRFLYGRRGEPYSFAGQTLRYLPGTRPVRPKYMNSSNSINRYDALQVAWISNHLSEGNAAIDIGVGSGMYTLPMAAKCGRTGAVIAFEPDPTLVAMLRRNIELNPRLKPALVRDLAVSDQCGEEVFYTRGGDGQSSLARSAVEFTAEHHVTQFKVEVTTLDVATASTPVNLVKIDAEGAEIRILRGARALLESDAQILCELHPYAWAEFGNSFEELAQLVAASGRVIHDLDTLQVLTKPKYSIVLMSPQNPS